MSNHTTCNDCIFNAMSADNPNKEIVRICVRFPPVVNMVATQQGVAVSTAYPMIKNDLTACGEWDDGADIVLEHSDKLYD